jgi:hypothetical protein
VLELIVVILIEFGAFEMFTCDCGVVTDDDDDDKDEPEAATKLADAGVFKIFT